MSLVTIYKTTLLDRNHKEKVKWDGRDCKWERRGWPGTRHCTLPKKECRMDSLLRSPGISVKMNHQENTSQKYWQFSNFPFLVNIFFGYILKSLKDKELDIKIDSSNYREHPGSAGEKQRENKQTQDYRRGGPIPVLPITGGQTSTGMNELLKLVHTDPSTVDFTSDVGEWLSPHLSWCLHVHTLQLLWNLRSFWPVTIYIF